MAAVDESIRIGMPLVPGIVPVGCSLVRAPCGCLFLPTEGQRSGAITILCDTHSMDGKEQWADELQQREWEPPTPTEDDDGPVAYA